MSWLKSNKYIWLILLIASCLVAVGPLLHDGFPATDDGGWMVIRFSSFYQAFADGQLPVRFLHRLNFGYGYPVATFLYPGFMYFSLPFHFLKIGFADTIKLVMAISFFGSSIFTYLWLNRIFKNKLVAFTGALVSLYIPYHLYDAYVRGSVGEILALLWAPFIFWMIERKNPFFICIGISLLILSHNTLAVLFLPMIVLYMLLKIYGSENKRKVMYTYISVLLMALGLSAFFTIPALFELQFTQFSKTTISDPTSYFADISLIGVLTLLIFIIAGGLFIFRKKSHNELNKFAGLFLLITFFTVFLSSAYSSFLWKIIPSSFIQFPFRLLSFLVISVPFLTSYIFYKTERIYKKIIVFVMILILILITARQYFSSIEYIYIDEGFYATNDATTTVKNEYVPNWVKTKLSKRAKNKVELIKGDGEVTNLVYNNKEITFDVELQENTRIRINTIYWPGWKLLIDNKETKILYDNKKGVIEFQAPKGNHRIKVSFSETRLRLASDTISVLSLFVLLIMMTQSKTKNRS